MKNIILAAALIFSAGPAVAGPYENLAINTGTQKAVKSVSGSVKVAATAASSETYTITLDGETGLITAVRINAAVAPNYVDYSTITTRFIGDEAILASIGVDTKALNVALAAEIARAIAAEALLQPLDSDLTDLADGSLTGSKVGSGILAANIADGTMGVVNTGGNANTASALAANPSPCPGGQVVTDIAADGTLTCGPGMTNTQPSSSTVFGVMGATGSVIADSDKVYASTMGAGHIMVPYGVVATTGTFGNSLRISTGTRIGFGTLLTPTTVNIDIVGSVRISSPIWSAGGNARGAGSFDFQLTRSAATQVASGANSVIGGGVNNTASADNVTISGGTTNTASSLQCTIGGGSTNSCSSSTGGTIGGGVSNSVSDSADPTIPGTVGGGRLNSASNGSVVAGGYQNTASGYGGVGSGILNVASNGGSGGAWVGGGTANQATGRYSTISGGSNATASGEWSTVIGGRLCTATQGYAVSGGRRAQATAIGAWALSDSTDADFPNATADSWRSRFSGGYYFSGGVATFTAVRIDGALTLLGDTVYSTKLTLNAGTTFFHSPTQTTGTGVNITTETAGNYAQSNIADFTVISTSIPCGFGTGIASVTLTIPATLSSGPWTWGWAVYGVSATTGTPSIYFDHQNKGTHYSWNSNNANANGPASGTSRSWCVLTSSSTSGTYPQRFQMEANGEHAYTGNFTVNRRDYSKVIVDWRAGVRQSSLGTGAADAIWGACEYDGPGSTAPTAITFAEPPTTEGQPTWCGEVWIKKVGK